MELYKTLQPATRKIPTFQNKIRGISVVQAELLMPSEQAKVGKVTLPRGRAHSDGRHDQVVNYHHVRRSERKVRTGRRGSRPSG